MEELRRIEIRGFIVKPPRTFPGKRPVLIAIHGGPEAQARPDFSDAGIISSTNWASRLSNERPRLVGLRQTFVALDNGMKRGIVRDIGALLDWIATQTDLDENGRGRGRKLRRLLGLGVATCFSDRSSASSTSSAWPTRIVSGRIPRLSPGPAANRIRR